MNNALWLRFRREMAIKGLVHVVIPPPISIYLSISIHLSISIYLSIYIHIYIYTYVYVYM